MKAFMLFSAKKHAFTISSAFVLTVILLAANAVVGYRNIQLRRSIDDLRNHIQSQQKQLALRNSSCDRTSEVEQFLNEWHRSQIGPKSIPLFITGLADHASKAGLQVVKITPGTGSATGWLMFCPFETEFRGTSERLLTFLSQLDRLGNAIVINAITIERATENSSDLRVRMKFTAYGEKSE